MKGFQVFDRVLYLIYNILFIFLSPFLLAVFSWRILLRPSYRKGARERFGFLPSGIGKRELNQRLLWVHAVSVGEVLASVPLIRAIKKKYPLDRLILSTVTVTGHEVARQKLPELDHLIFFPFDFPLVTKAVVQKIRPNLFIFLETELWPNLLRSLKRGGIPSLLVNGRVSPKSFKNYRKIRWFFKRVLSHVSQFSVQTQRDARFLIEMGADPGTVECTGNMKYDQQFRVFTDENLKSFREELGIDEKSFVAVVGSTHEGEEEAILSYFDEMCLRWGPFIMILAPRHIERIESIEKILKQKKIPYLRKTVLVGLVQKGERGLSSSGIILLDTMGELSSYYSLATVVFVGGSLVPIGGHNILEPAAYGKLSFFGPHMENFSEISELMLERGGGQQVADVESWISAVEVLLKNPEQILHRGKEALKVVEENKGAVERNMVLIQKYLDKPLH